MLSEVSNEFGKIVEQASPAVVRVEARKRFPASGIIFSEDGLIITANHVLRRDNKIKIGLADGSATSAELIGRDPSTDLALVKADVSGPSPLKLVEGDSVTVGNLVLALGRPGRTVQATLGIISALGYGWQTRAGGQVDQYIQTDVLMYPGFSGGPLVSAGGELIGLNSSAIVHGVSVTIPAATINRVADALQKYGRIRRGYLGVSTQVVRLQDPIHQELGQQRGLLIVAVEPDSPAEKGGLTIGDTIVKLDSSIIRRHDDLVARLMQAKPGEKVPVTIVRGGEIQTVNVKIGERE